MPDTFTPEQIAQILEAFFAAVGTRQYIGARYVPLFGRKDEESIIWDNSAPYEPLTVVLYQGNSFTSRQYVPAGVEITNEEFWAETGNFNAQVEQYRQEVMQLRADYTQYKEDLTASINQWETNTSAALDEWKDDTVEDFTTAIDNIPNILPSTAFSAQNTVEMAIANATTKSSNLNNMYKFLKKDAYQFATVIGHQGTSTMCPGNTAIAYDIANRLGVDAFETDIQMTSDGDFVCMHDFTLQSYCDLQGYASDYTIDTLRNTPITYGAYVDKWPTQTFLSLSDFIAICKRYAKIAVIELKAQEVTESIIQTAINKIKEYGYYDNTILIGSASVEVVRQIDAHIPYMLVTGSNDLELIDILAEYNCGIDLNYVSYTNEVYEYCKSHNVPLGLWTYNDVGSVAFEDTYKCDFVTTDNVMSLNGMPTMSLAEIGAIKDKEKCAGFVAKTAFAKNAISNGIVAGFRVDPASPHTILATPNGITVPKHITSEHIMRIGTPKIVSNPMRNHQIGFTQYNEQANLYVDMGYMTNYPSDFAYSYPVFANNKIVPVDTFFYLQNMQQAIFAYDFYDTDNTEFIDTGLTLVKQDYNKVFNSTRPAFGESNFIGPDRLFLDKAIVSLSDDVPNAYVFVGYYSFDTDMNRTAVSNWTQVTAANPVTVSVPSGAKYIQPFINVYQDANHSSQYQYRYGASTPWFQVLNNICFAGA